MLVVLPTPPFWLATVSTRRRDGRGIRCRSGCSTRAARAASSAIGVQPGCGDVSRETWSRHSSALRRTRTRSRRLPLAADAPRRPPCSADRRCRPRTSRSGGRRRPSRRTARGVPLDLGGGAGHALHGEHHAHPAAQGKAPRGEPVPAERPHATSPRRLPPIACRTAVSSARPRSTSTGSSRSATTSRSHSTRRASGSTSTTRRSGRASANGIPGRPAPDPMSTTRAPSGIELGDHRAVQDVPIPDPRRLPRARRAPVRPRWWRGARRSAGRAATARRTGAGSRRHRARSGTAEDDDLAPRLLALALARHALHPGHRVVHDLALERRHRPQPHRLAARRAPPSRCAGPAR